MCNGAAGKGNMRLRSGKNCLPSGSVLSRLHERLHAIARKDQHGAQLPIYDCAPSHFNGPNPLLLRNLDTKAAGSGGRISLALAV
jgi:hypothetical protein